MELGTHISMILVSTLKAQAFKAQLKELMISTARHKLVFGGPQKQPGVPLMLVRAKAKTAVHRSLFCGTERERGRKQVLSFLLSFKTHLDESFKCPVLP